MLVAAWFSRLPEKRVRFIKPGISGNCAVICGALRRDCLDLRPAWVST